MNARSLRWMVTVCVALTMTGCMSLMRQDSTASITAAVDDPLRPAEDRLRDEVRKPVDTLRFAGVKPGDRVCDFIMGGGYFTRLFARAVGPAGKVYAFQPAEFIQLQPSAADSLREVTAAYPNVQAIDASLAAIAFPEPLDLILTALNYHDLHMKIAPEGTAAAVDAALFNALKHGGVLVVIDHHAVAGSGVRDADALHRIDVESVKQELSAAGFVLAGESQLLHRSGDSRTTVVFDPAIRGRTDQFMLKFRKP